MKNEFNCPPGWYRWDEQTPEIGKQFTFLRIDKRGVPDIFTTKLTTYDDSYYVDGKMKTSHPDIQVHSEHPMIWCYNQDFAKNLFAYMQLSDSNPTTQVDYHLNN